MKKAKTTKGIDLSINKPNAKLNANQKLIKVLKSIKQIPTKILVKECDKSLPIINAPYHAITLYLDRSKFDLKDFCKRSKLSNYHVHIGEGDVITEKGPVNPERQKISTGKVSEYSFVTIVI